MNKLVKNRMLIISISLALLVLINIAVSYSYYLGKVEGNETTTTLSFTSVGVIIEYENNSGSITDTNIIPGWSTTKTFKVKSTMKANEGNNNDTKLGYAVKMIVDNNDFPTNSIAYSLAQGSKTGNGQAMEAATDVGIATGANSEGIIIGTGYFVVGDNEHNYTLTIKYMDSETVDGNKNFGIHLVVETVKAVTVTVDLNGGTYTGSTTKYIPLGMAVSIEEPIKEGAIFIGWEKTNGDVTVSGNKIIANSLAITVQAKYIIPTSFADDDWATIAAYVKANKEATASVYSVGSEKKVEIDIDGNGTAESYTVRVANNSHYYSNTESENKCKDKNGNVLTSQTACGFVVEFVDIVEQRAMNSGVKNVGGWPATAMRKYLNGEFLAKLPIDLQSVIADTTVVSGHGSTRGETNFISKDDKMYLLSTAEVWARGVSNDTARSSTRQLDYYENNKVTTSKYSGAIKKNNAGSAARWWLRTANSGDSSFFYCVESSGVKYSNFPSSSYGVAPAFRII